MSKWFRAISSSPDYGPLAEALEWFENEHEQAQKDTHPTGRLWKASQSIAGVMELRWNQLQELEAILGFLEIERKKVFDKWHKHYANNYSKALTEAQAAKHAEREIEVLNIELIIVEVALVRNKFLGLTKALEALAYQLGNLTRLKVAGVEDAEL